MITFNLGCQLRTGISCGTLTSHELSISCTLTTFIDTYVNRRLAILKTARWYRAGFCDTINPICVGASLDVVAFAQNCCTYINIGACLTLIGIVCQLTFVIDSTDLHPEFLTGLCIVWYQAAVEHITIAC
jgi:hypothetical protein